ncbi:MAG: hypothetical protein HGA73_05190, partial [Syntrophaceae bacterium]|nr:hypothetical protein [Syntrophaceae bacterium]
MNEVLAFVGMEHKRKQNTLTLSSGETQRMADEKKAYTLTDRRTWRATKDKDKLDLMIVLEGDPILFNRYGVMADNPEKHKHVIYKEVMDFVNGIISKRGAGCCSGVQRQERKRTVYSECQIAMLGWHGPVDMREYS